MIFPNVLATREPGFLAEEAERDEVVGRRGDLAGKQHEGRGGEVDQVAQLAGDAKAVEGNQRMAIAVGRGRVVGHVRAAIVHAVPDVSFDEGVLRHRMGAAAVVIPRFVGVLVAFIEIVHHGLDAFAAHRDAHAIRFAREGDAEVGAEGVVRERAGKRVAARGEGGRELLELGRVDHDLAEVRIGGVERLIERVVRARRDPACELGSGFVFLSAEDLGEE